MQAPRLVIRRCLQCFALYLGDDDDDRKCPPCASRASSEMLGGVLLALGIMFAFVLVGFVRWVTL